MLVTAAAFCGAYEGYKLWRDPHAKHPDNADNNLLILNYADAD